MKPVHSTDSYKLWLCQAQAQARNIEPLEPTAYEDGSAHACQRCGQAIPWDCEECGCEELDELGQD